MLLFSWLARSFDRDVPEPVKYFHTAASGIQHFCHQIVCLWHIKKKKKRKTQYPKAQIENGKLRYCILFEKEKVKEKRVVVAVVV